MTGAAGGGVVGSTQSQNRGNNGQQNNRTPPQQQQRSPRGMPGGRIGYPQQQYGQFYDQNIPYPPPPMMVTTHSGESVSDGPQTYDSGRGHDGMELSFGGVDNIDGMQSLRYSGTPRHNNAQLQQQQSNRQRSDPNRHQPSPIPEQGASTNQHGKRRTATGASSGPNQSIPGQQQQQQQRRKDGNRNDQSKQLSGGNKTGQQKNGGNSNDRRNTKGGKSETAVPAKGPNFNLNSADFPAAWVILCIFFNIYD